MKKVVNFLKKGIDKGKYFLLSLQLAVYGVFSNTCPVLAKKTETKTTTETISAADISEKFESAVGWIQGTLLILAVISVLVYFALPHIVGGEEGAAKGRKALKGIIIGLIVGVLAVPLAGTVYSWFA